MRRLLVSITLYLFCSLLAYGQDNLQQVDTCFEKIADDYFKNKEYEKARDSYKIILDKNPKDLTAKRQYDLCVAQLTPHLANYIEAGISPGLEMVAVQGGTFMMGCTSEQSSDCDDCEKPAHEVTVSSFYIGKYEVTQAQWRSIMVNNPSPSHFKGDSLPVEQVSWDDVQEFIQKLNEQTGKQYRLPTEAEWEFAARGGVKSNSNKYSGSNNLEDVAWYSKNSENTTHPVGKKQPNELDINDMSGNVWEWCTDWFGNYSNNAQTNPKGRSFGIYRVYRGGSWYSYSRLVRVSYRISSSPTDHDYCVGFRLACSSK